MNDKRVGAVILATKDTGFSGPTELGGAVAPLIEVGGETLVSRVIRAATVAKTITTTILVGARGEADAPYGADRHVDGIGVPSGDIRVGLGALDGYDYALLIPGNIPFVTGAEIDAFVEASVASGAQVTYPLVTRTSCEPAFPELRRTYFRLVEGELTNGNALFVHVPSFTENLEVIDKAVELRRDPWRIAMHVNPLVLLSFKSGRMRAADIAAAVQSAMGVSAAALLLDAPGLATDIRKPIDLKVARERLG